MCPIDRDELSLDIIRGWRLYRFTFILSGPSDLDIFFYFSRGYDVLYDEQTDGLAERRAYPLILPGMAEIPFDPNDHPVPKDTTPWWQVIVDFYKGDPEEWRVSLFYCIDRVH